MSDKQLKGKVVVVSGATRGIGYAIAEKAAMDGANIVVLGHSVEKQKALSGTIYSARDTLQAITGTEGGEAIAIACDIRFADQIEAAISEISEKFGRIDILVNNASALNLLPIEVMKAKQFDLIQDVNGRGTYLLSSLCLPLLLKSDQPRVLTLSPPIDLSSRWLGPHLAYSMSKFNMTMVTLGLAASHGKSGLIAHSLWPETAIWTAAVENLLKGQVEKSQCRKVGIVADAAYLLLTDYDGETTGGCYIDADVLKASGVEDLTVYAMEPGKALKLDLFLSDRKPES